MYTKQGIQKQIHGIQSTNIQNRFKIQVGLTRKTQEIQGNTCAQEVYIKQYVYKKYT